MYFIYYYLAKWIWQLPPLAKVAVSNFDRYYEMKEMNILSFVTHKKPLRLLFVLGRLV